MESVLQRKLKSSIILILTVLLAVSFFGSLDESYDSFDGGGSISSVSSAHISGALSACLPVAVSRDGQSSGTYADRLARAGSASDILSRIVRKLLQTFGGAYAGESVARFRSYFLSVCTISFAYLFLLTSVRYFHLKDGSK